MHWSNGNFIIQPQFDATYSFNECVVVVGLNDKWGYIKNPLTVQLSMITLVKCKIINSNAGDITRGMKVYKYTGGKKRRGKK